MNAHYSNGTRAGYWAPAPAQPLPSPYALADREGSPSLGQTALLQHPAVALLTDGVLLGTSAYMAWGLGAVRNKWSTFWWVVAGVAAVKGLHDMSRL